MEETQSNKTVMRKIALLPILVIAFIIITPFILGGILIMIVYSTITGIIDWFHRKKKLGDCIRERFDETFDITD